MFFFNGKPGHRGPSQPTKVFFFLAKVEVVVEVTVELGNSDNVFNVFPLFMLLEYKEQWLVANVPGIAVRPVRK